jgi:predicted nucleic acid-binding protein
MKTVFADTLYWIAIVLPHDQWAVAAKSAKASVEPARILTTDEVLGEFLTALQSGGDKLRGQAVKMVRAILENPNVKVVPQTHAGFMRGVELYEQRPDKSYSLTDCISMNAMLSESITEVLTGDSHFAQEGFNVLIKQ